MKLLAFMAVLLFSTAVANAEDAFRPREYQPDVAELRDVLGLDVYKFVIKSKTGDKFKIVLREVPKLDAEPVVLFKESFVVGTLRDDDIAVTFSFLKLDNTLGSALGSNLPTMNLKLSGRGFTPGNIAKTRPVPLAGMADKEIRNGQGNVFLKIKSPREVYPYAELVIERDE
jgi:hypothetical protein